MRIHFIAAVLVAAMAIATVLPVSAPAFAEEREYGSVWLNGLARNDWHLNPAGEDNTMVCNVNGADGWLAIRSGPGSKYAARRKLKRLAIVVVDTSKRNGHWVRVTGAHRTHTVHGLRLSKYRDLPVTGWAHDGYLCGFTD